MSKSPQNSIEGLNYAQRHLTGKAIVDFSDFPMYIYFVEGVGALLQHHSTLPQIS